MIHPPSVIAVDDDPQELATIVQALRQLDVACLPVLVEGTKVDIRAPLSGVRLVFFDINYLKAVTNDVAMFEAAATILCKVLAPDNGPYVLITWSSKADKHDGLMAHFATHVAEIPAPAVTGFLQKEKFTPDGAAKDGGASLREQIMSVIADQPQIRALMQWETSARRAAGDVICSLLELFSREDRFAARYGPVLHGVLAHMARAAVGSENVAADRRGAINEALVPILFDRLMHQLPEEGEVQLWTDAITLAPGVPSPDPAHGSHLNALSHIARAGSGPMEAGDRGVVFMLPEGAGQKMAARTQLALQDIAADFLSSQSKGQNKSSPPDMAEVAKDCRWVFVGMRAICDQAQAKGTMRPVVLALEVPGTMKDRGLGLRFNNHGAISTTPCFMVPPPGGGPSANRRLIVDWHWTTSLSEAEMAGATVLYRVREPLMSQLASQMSGYSARPGIITFD